MKIKMPQFKKNISHPNFIIGAFSFLLLLAGALLSGNNFMFGGYMMAAAFALGFIHWIWRWLMCLLITILIKEVKCSGQLWLSFFRPWVVYYYIMKRKNVQL